ncbi:unnamed protein product, partial [Staurois parvus]
MALGRKGLTFGAIKGLTVCCVCFTKCTVFHCKHTALYGCAMQSHTKKCSGADRGEICGVYTQVSPLSEILVDHRVSARN